MPYADMRAAIEALPGKDKTGGGRMARCPVHDDDTASLSVDYGDDGRLLLNCHAGCRTEDIVAALGGTTADLFPPDGTVNVRVIRSRRTAPAGNREFECYYPDGTKAGLHRRVDDGHGGKRIWFDPTGIKVNELAMFGTWNLSPEGPVVVVEGERATNAVRAAGLAAVGTYGSSYRPSAAALQALAGRDVVLWPDNDEPGRKHMAAIAEALGRDVRTVTPPSDAVKGWDAADADADTIRALVAAASSAVVRPRVRRISDYGSTPVQWLWPGWLPRGNVTLFDGNPGEAKSTLVMAIIACVTTTRPWPDGTPSGDPASVLIITREDDPSRVLRPRLEVAGADIDRVLFLDEEFVMPSDADKLRLAIEDDVVLVFIDPLFSHIEGTVKTISDNDIRTAVMTPLSEVASAKGVSILAMRHNSKDTTKSALLRGAGSLGGLAGAARSMWGAAPDPDDDDGTHKLFGVTKSNYAKKPPAWRYRVVSAVPPGQVWVGHSVSKVEWLGPSELSIDDVLAEEDHDAARDAATVLVSFLESKGGSAPSTDVQAHMRSKGIGNTAFKAAKKRVGAKSTRVGFDGGWTIHLPQEVQEVTGDPFEEVASNPLDSLVQGAQVVGASLPPHPLDSLDSLDPFEEVQEVQEVQEASAPRARVRAWDGVHVDCRDLRAHQSSHRQTRDGFVCDICSQEES